MNQRIIKSKLAEFHVAVLATDGFEESELTEPVKALREAGPKFTDPFAQAWPNSGRASRS